VIESRVGAEAIAGEFFATSRTWDASGLNVDAALSHLSPLRDQPAAMGGKRGCQGSSPTSLPIEKRMIWGMSVWKASISLVASLPTKWRMARSPPGCAASHEGGIRRTLRL